MPTGNKISAYQIEREQERMETKAYRRKHLEQFIRDHKRIYFRELYTTVKELKEKPIRSFPENADENERYFGN
jgi:hypothetical protein